MSKLDGIDPTEEMDWKSLGLRIGLEIHRQLSGPKLFCSCTVKPIENDTVSFHRRFCITSSEIGDKDRAAQHEMMRSNTTRYLMDGTCCLVEMDEEPPHIPSDDIIDTALMISELFRIDVVDNIQFMRKIVIDGSNTSGFQRTAMIGMDGIVNVPGRTPVDITSICLEEDSARISEDENRERIYRLDRLGIPEIEITTGSFMSDPHHCAETALRIGEVLRSTGKVRRGIGTVRQDVNVSITGGARVELKLVQDISSIPELIRNEALRQLLLINVSETLKDRGIKSDDIRSDLHDITELFDYTGSRVLRRSLDKGGSIICIKLPGFAGTMGDRIHWKKLTGEVGKENISGFDDRRRLGPEFAQYAKARAGVSGLFHSDELPAYGITEEDVNKMIQHLEIDPALDGFVMITGPKTQCERALLSVIDRARLSLLGVPEEVRRPLTNGSSEFMRPMPGAARMYPETDIPLIPVNMENVMRIYNQLPEDPVKYRERLTDETKLSSNTIDQMYNLDILEIFSDLVTDGADPRTASALLLQDFQRVRESSYDPSCLSTQSLSDIMEGISDGKYSKEMLSGVLITAVEYLESGSDEKDAVGRSINEHSASDDILDQLDQFIMSLIIEKADFIKSRGMSSVGPLMGPVMERFRGTIDGNIISKRLSELIKSEIR